MTKGAGLRVVVVDASLAAMWVLREPYSSHALTLAVEWAVAGFEVIAPSLMLVEVTSALCKRVRRGEIDFNLALEALDLVLGFGVRIENESGLHWRALALAHLLNCPTPYDARYLALAEMRGCEVWTGDGRLYSSVRLELPWVRRIRAFNPPNAKE